MLEALGAGGTGAGQVGKTQIIEKGAFGKG